MVGPIIRSIQTQSNKQMNSMKSYVQSEKNFNTQDKLQNEMIHNPIKIINKNKESVHKAYFNNIDNTVNEQLF